ncbi:MAG: hypothetical protein K0S55_1536, partial [Clostridia bacterium]|nr:hypothetical protein [Clostridia bacterium]
SVPASETLTANAESVTATRAAIESYKEGGILNGKNSLASFPAKLVAAPAIVVEEPVVEESTDENPDTADTMMASWMVLAVIAGFAAFTAIRKFCK